MGGKGGGGGGGGGRGRGGRMGEGMGCWRNGKIGREGGDTGTVEVILYDHRAMWVAWDGRGGRSRNQCPGRRATMLC